MGSLSQNTVYRVQDREGRGPWRPGFSDVWSDTNLTEAEWQERYRQRPPIHVEFGIEVFRKVPRGWAAGVGCRSIESLLAWFTTPELECLYSLGYSAVEIEADKIIAESPRQLVFARIRPLNFQVRQLLFTEVAA